MRVTNRSARARTGGGLVALALAAPLLVGLLVAGELAPADPAASQRGSDQAPDDDAVATLSRSSAPTTGVGSRDEPLAAPARDEPAEEPTAPPEPYPSHEPQTSCEVVDHRGVERLRDVVLAAHPDTVDGGIVRDCHAGGSSEHKEGRAWDWMLDAHDPADAAAAEEVLGWLLADDEDGTPHAMARRLGVLYVIWDGRIWNAARPEQGWQPYTGASPHTDHVHLSFSAAGARGETSFFADVWDPEVGATYPATVPVEDDVLA